MSPQSDGSMQAYEIFSSVALLATVTQPANMVMTLVPRAVAVMANFARVQAYLAKPSIQDNRQCTVEDNMHQFTSVDSVSIKSASMGFPILRNVSLGMQRGEIVLCVGVVGSGKTTLAIALLGEAHLTTGTIRVPSKQIAYCAQEAWLPSTTICDAITGVAVDMKLEWYDTVVDACGLLLDFKTLPEGDMTVIENNGINLSGGQRQRIVSIPFLFSTSVALNKKKGFSSSCVLAVQSNSS